MIDLKKERRYAMGYKTPAEIRANTKYIAKTYDRIMVKLRKDGDLRSDDIKAAAAAEGLSLNAYVVQAIREKMERAN